VYECAVEVKASQYGGHGNYILNISLDLPIEDLIRCVKRFVADGGCSSTYINTPMLIRCETYLPLGTHSSKAAAIPASISYASIKTRFIPYSSSFLFTKA
jgi:hypothetical protein